MLADVTDVVARLGRDLTDAEQARVPGLLEEASELVAGWLGCPTLPDPVPGAVRIVTSRCVARVLAAGEGGQPGATQQSQTMGPFGVTYSYGESSSGAPWLTRADKTMLRRHACRGRAQNVGTSRW